jgi:hypothetical protein
MFEDLNVWMFECLCPSIAGLNRAFHNLTCHDIGCSLHDTLGWAQKGSTLWIECDCGYLVAGTKQFLLFKFCLLQHTTYVM